MLTKPLDLDVHEQIECAQTLASRFYTDPAILEIEKTRIFQRTWQLAGTLSQSCGEVNGVPRTIADPESFFTADVAGEPIIVVRDKQGELRAFSNVCRHRAGPIALGSGCKNVLRCQYHGWTYTLDGRLIGTPDVEGVEFFDRSTMGMVPLRCETWEQFIFVNFDLKAEPLSTYLGQIPQQAKGFQFAGLQFAERRDYVIDCNWKVYVDNYLEGYHIPIAHPGLMKEIDYAQYRTDTFRYYSQQFAPIRAMKAEDAGERLYAPGAGLQQALYFWIFPNLMLNIYPDNISTNLIVPLSHEKTLTIFEWFFHDVASQKNQERIKRSVAFSDEVQQEDIALCENVQRGLRSSTYDRGRYSVKRENGVHHFHMLLGEFLGEAVTGDDVPVIVLLMGPAGSGKTTIGELLAAQLKWHFADGDNFHSPANIEKMSRGVPLSDEDRIPWLNSIRDAILQWDAQGRNAVLACSALKRSYRELLQINSNVKLVYLKGSYELFQQRLRSRKGHYAGEQILAGQFADLEEPTDAITIDAAQSPQQIVAEIRKLFALS